MNFNVNPKDLSNNALMIFNFYKNLNDQNIKYNNTFTISMDMQYGSILSEGNFIDDVENAFDELQQNNIIKSYSKDLDITKNRCVFRFEC